MGRNQFRFAEKTSTELTVFLMMAKKLFISGELCGANLIDALMSTWLTEVGFNWKNVQVKFILTTAKL